MSIAWTWLPSRSGVTVRVPREDTVAFDNREISRFEAGALSADSTTVDRRAAGPMTVIVEGRALRLLHIQVQALVGADVDAAWVGSLVEAARGAPSIKWKSDSVRSFVLKGQSLKASAVRDALARQTIIVVDPMADARSLDVDLLRSGLPSPLMSLLFVEGTGALVASAQEAFAELRHALLWMFLSDTGVGKITDLTRSALSLRRPAHAGGLSAPPRDDVEHLVTRDHVRVGKLAKLAMQSTALVAHELDPDLPGHAAFRAIAPDMAFWRFREDAEPRTAARRLGVIGQSEILFDMGEVATADVERLRAEAASVAALSPGCRPLLEGRVGSCDDADNLRTQLADVAAGFASSRLADFGFVGLATDFRLVLFNGRRLTLEDAERLDRERADFRRFAT